MIEDSILGIKFRQAVDASGQTRPSYDPEALARARVFLDHAQALADPLKKDASNHTLPTQAGIPMRIGVFVDFSTTPPPYVNKLASIPRKG
jgi:hypothetical protein